MTWSHSMLRPRAARARLPLPASATLRGWFDFSDPTTLFQDAAGTIPVASCGDPIARINNKAAGGEPLTIGYPSGRPTWQPLGDGRRGANFDGFDDALIAADPTAWKFLHDGIGAVVCLRFRLAGDYDGPLAYNVLGSAGMVLNAAKNGAATYVAALVNGGLPEVTEPTWVAETPSEPGNLQLGPNTLVASFARFGTTNVTQIRTNGVLRASVELEVPDIYTDSAGPLMLIPWSTPHLTFAELLVYETTEILDQIAAVERYLAS